MQNYYAASDLCESDGRDSIQDPEPVQCPWSMRRVKQKNWLVVSLTKKTLKRFRPKIRVEIRNWQVAPLTRRRSHSSPAQLGSTFE